ncbi:MAG TPA: lysophospholipid acyltransferase family protein [Opitutaceae bacterium]|jgi:1-acyl-sn-glycerol-3-phosphate acyltransferase|nr:lysophospholipid acyltransferase family protein [Opitutaceae bacterium]
MRLIARAYFIFAYFLSWLLFGVVGLALNFMCALLLLFPRRARFGPAVRHIIRALFASWLKWLHAARGFRFDWRGFDAPLPTGVVYVANHPSLVDATFLLARLPDTVCIFKPALLRNPALGPAARMAGYVAGDTGIDLIHAATEAVIAGRSILIFPEGTRTVTGVTLNPLKPGFALIAARAAAPVQLIVIRAPRDLCPKGRPWWHVPRFPVRVEITLGDRLQPSPDQSAAELTAEVERRLLAALIKLPPSPLSTGSTGSPQTG